MESHHVVSKKRNLSVFIHQITTVSLTTLFAYWPSLDGRFVNRGEQQKYTFHILQIARAHQLAMYSCVPHFPLR